MFVWSEQIIGKWDLSHSKFNNYKKASVKTDNPIKEVVSQRHNEKQKQNAWVGWAMPIGSV